MKLTTFADFTGHPDLTSHGLDQAGRNGEAQTDAAITAGNRAIFLRERVKNRIQLGRWNAYPGILDRELDLLTPVIARD